MQRGAVVRHEHGRPPDRLGRLSERELAAAVHRPPPPSTAFHRPHDLFRQPRVLRPADQHDPDSGRQALRQLSIIGPPFRAPDRPRRERHERRLHAVRTEERLRCRPILRADHERRPRRRYGRARQGGAGGEGQSQQPVHLVPCLRPRSDVGIEQRPPVVEPDPPRDAGEPHQERRPQGAMGKIRPIIPLRPQRAGESEQPFQAAIAALLIVGDHAAHGRVRLDQRCRGRGGHDVHRPVPSGDGVEQRRREHDVPEKRGLDDEASQPAGPPETLPAGSPPCPPASSASSPLSASRAACACASRRRHSTSP